MQQKSAVAGCCWLLCVWLATFGCGRLVVTGENVNSTSTNGETARQSNGYHQLCNSDEDCDLNQECALMVAETGPDGARFCNCPESWSWDPFEHMCRASTLEQPCLTSADCGWTQDCIAYGYISLCGCGAFLSWDHSVQECRFEWCDDSTCNATQGFRCYGLECRECIMDGYDVCGDAGYNPEPEQWNGSSQSVPLIAIFGLFSVSMMIVLLAWKCSVLKRLRQQTIPTAFVASMPNEAQQQPTTPDDPPKYSNLVPPTWINERDVLQRATPASDLPATSTASAPHLPMDSPPPYAEIMIAPRRVQ